MAANLIVSFKDSLMGVPAGLRYKILANGQVIDNGCNRFGISTYLMK